MFVEGTKVPFGLSTMVVGITNKLEGNPIAIEATDWSFTDLSKYPGLRSVHLGITPPTISGLKEVTLDFESPFLRRGRRLGIAGIIDTPKETLAKLERLGKEVYAVVHPTIALYLTDVKIPDNVTLVVENDDLDGRIVRRLGEILDDKNADPRSPETIRKLAAFLSLKHGRRVGIVLDIAHLENYQPDADYLRVKEILGGQIDILHVATATTVHGAPNAKLVKEATVALNPGIVVSEGPEPGFPFFVSKKHLQNIRQTVFDITGDSTQVI